MAEPVYVPPSFPTPPPGAPEPPPRSTGVKTIAAGACLVAFVTMGFVGKAVVRSLLPSGGTAGVNETAVDDPLTGVSTPDQLIRHGNEKGGYVFRRKLARAAERATKRSAPGSSVVFDEETVIEDLGAVVRGRVGYRGQVRDTPDDFDGVKVEGEQRQYFHSQGAVIVDAVCLPALSGCGNRDTLLDNTEAQVLDNLSQPGIDALLPARGRCDVNHQVMAGSLATCEFRDGLVLTLQKLELSDAQRTLRGLSGDPGSRSKAR